MQWTTSDNLRSVESRVLDGPLGGQTIMVRQTKDGTWRYPDVFSMEDYNFDPEHLTWSLVEED